MMFLSSSFFLKHFIYDSMCMDVFPACISKKAPVPWNWSYKHVTDAENLELTPFAHAELPCGC